MSGKSLGPYTVVSELEIAKEFLNGRTLADTQDAIRCLISVIIDLQAEVKALKGQFAKKLIQDEDWNEVDEISR